jgi:acyl-CoA thioesterase-1
MKVKVKAVLFLLINYSFLQEAHPQTRPGPTSRFISKTVNRVSIDSTYHYKVAAVDAPGQLIKISAESLPSWLRYDAASQTITGKPQLPGQYFIHLVAKGVNAIAHQRFLLTVYNKQTTNILAIGNSITNGIEKQNSYRRDLWKLLKQSNFNFDMIGSWSNNAAGDVPNPDFDMDHEGHSGWKASEILHQPDWDMQRGNLYEWIKGYSPDIVLLELGTNEVFQCITPAEGLRSVTSIIEIIRAKNARVKIFVAQIPPLGAMWADKKLCGDNISYSQAIINYNDAIRALVAKMNSPGSPVILVDQYSGIHPAIDMNDDIHPNNIGEKKVAMRWYNAINKYLKKL